MEEMMKMLKVIQEDILAQKQEIKSMEESIKISINRNIDEKFTFFETKARELEEKLERQQNALDHLEKQARRKNLILFGVEETEHNYLELEDLVLNVMRNVMKTNCERSELDTVRRMGYKKKDKVRPIVVTLTTMGRKIDILRNRKTLQNSHIYLKEEYPPKVLEKRKELQEELRREREQGNKVILKYDKIIKLKNTKDKTRNNKRNVSISPENEKNKENNTKIKQTAKKTKSIKHYLEPTAANSRDQEQE